MSTYHPHRWVIIEVTKDGITYKKVFSGNYGGFTDADTWKLSSAIESVTEDLASYRVLCMSGSTYICYKTAYGMSNYMNSMYSQWQENKDPDSTIKLLDKYDTRRI